ncbi:hypothetical protein [Pseudomarimonas arenosa]|uniref:Cadherin domain-containing protein n=1 Tax=Pseudomarimonas arenosa TaxID=2774145 RepID=A0AAW3ZRE3_9GAMM|nr:hypothetical protein [Pseudomarimonas arenosa]MBD8527122.1 hypothetical protein [Pseudomarimonas arenosa]
MSQRISPRRRMVEAIAVALAAAPLAVSAANPSAKPVVSESAPMICSGKESTGSLALQYTPFGWALAEVGDDPKSACNMKLTTANLHVLFPGDGDNTVLLESAPVFSLAAKQFSLEFVEPVLCESYYPVESPNLLSLQLTGPDGAVQTVRGVSALNYSLPVAGQASTGRLSPVMANGSFGPWVQCYGVPYTSLVVGVPDVPASDATATDLVFAAGFEDQVAPAMRSDLKVEILDGPVDTPTAFLTRNLTKTVNIPFQYSIRVRNIGMAAANNVRLKEFVPTTGPLTPLVQAQAFTCVDRASGETMADPGTTCAGGTGVLNASGFSVPAGGSRTYTLTRNVPSGTTGQKSVLAAGLFFDPQDAVGQGDVATNDNSAAAVINLIENQAPTIACVSNPGGSPIGATINLTEDDPTAPRNFLCTLVDPETDPLHPTTPFTATSSNQNLISNASLLGSPTGNQWPLSIGPQAETSGSAIITLTSQDDRGATRAVNVTVNVSNVNDPPEASLLHNDLRLSSAGDLPRDSGNQFVPATRTGCLSLPDGQGECQIEIVDFFAVSPGPNETSQTLTPNAVSCVNEGGSPIPEAVFTAMPTALVGVPPVTGAFNLRFTYAKNLPANTQIRCTFTFRDNGSPVENSATGAAAELLFTRWASS